jgi:hypothetical protein
LNAITRTRAAVEERRHGRQPVRSLK